MTPEPEPKFESPLVTLDDVLDSESREQVLKDGWDALSKFRLRDQNGFDTEVLTAIKSLSVANAKVSAWLLHVALLYLSHLGSIAPPQTTQPEPESAPEEQNRVRCPAMRSRHRCRRSGTPLLQPQPRYTSSTWYRGQSRPAGRRRGIQ